MASGTQQKEFIQQTESDIPLNWNGEFVDFQKIQSLREYKETLPISIQRIIEWAQKLIACSKVNNIDLDEIDEDLKHQYQKFNGDKAKLAQLYFDYDQEYNLMFYDKCHTVTHFLFYMFTGKKYNKEYNHVPSPYMSIDVDKRISIALKLLKLFIQNDIIDLNLNLRRDSISDTITDITGFLSSQWKVNASDDIMNNLQEFIDLIMMCMDRKYGDESNQEMLGVIIYKTKTDYKGRYQLRAPYFRQFRYYGQSYYAMCYDTLILEQLLFRGILPFAFHDVDDNEKDNIMLPYDDNIRDIKQHMSKVFDECNLCDLQNEDDAIVSDDARNKSYRELFMLVPMMMASPLILKPYLTKCKIAMNEIISQCELAPVSKMIIDFIYVDYNKYYDVEIQNNINVKCMIFIAQLIFLGMDQVFLNLYKKEYENKEFITYLLDNYSKWTAIAIEKKDTFNMDIIYSMIKIYYENGKKKYPMDGYYGLKAILTKTARSYKFTKSEKSFIDLLEFLHKSYGDTFDIKFTFDDGCSHGSNLPILLFRAFSHRNMELFKYLIVNHYNSSLDEVCNAIHENMTDAICGLYWIDYTMTDEDIDEDKAKYQGFMDEIKQFCLESVCQSDGDRSVLTQRINESWKQFMDFKRTY